MNPTFRRSFAFCLCIAMALGLAVSSSRATTVIAPSFDELLTRADTVFTGDVEGVRSEWEGEGPNRHIVSYATFNVLRVMKGEAASPYKLRMLGGSVGTRTLVVAEAPKFTAGERVIMFVKNNGKQFFPTVGIMHGVYRVTATSAADQAVADHAGHPLQSVEDIGKTTAEIRARRLASAGAGATAATIDGDSNSTALSRAQFESAITDRLRALGLH